MGGEVHNREIHKYRIIQHLDRKGTDVDFHLLFNNGTLLFIIRQNHPSRNILGRYMDKFLLSTFVTSLNCSDMEHADGLT